MALFCTVNGSPRETLAAWVALHTFDRTTPDGRPNADLPAGIAATLCDIHNQLCKLDERRIARGSMTEREDNRYTTLLASARGVVAEYLPAVHIAKENLGISLYSMNHAKDAYVKTTLFRKR